MIRQPAHVEARRPPLRGICLVVKENQPLTVLNRLCRLA